MSEGINPLEHAHYKSEELEKARQLLDDAKGKPESAACMDYIESEIRKMCEERMIRDESKD